MAALSNRMPSLSKTMRQPSFILYVEDREVIIDLDMGVVELCVRSPHSSFGHWVQIPVGLENRASYSRTVARSCVLH